MDAARREIRLIARVGLFAALCYATSLATVYLPNIKVMFLIIFAAGVLWGILPGMAVGAIGCGLWSAFNPFGPAPLPILAAQIAGAALIGLLGGAVGLKRWILSISRLSLALASVAGVVSSLLFFLPVNIVDAYLFGPFWPRFWISMTWSLVAIGSNAVIYPLLFPLIHRIYPAECRLRI